MDSNVVECDLSARGGVCVCKGGPTLDILKEVQRGYEDRMALIERVGGANKLQMQVEVLRSWVGDLVGQNTLLARAVEELETEATTRLLLERRRHSERDKKKRTCGNITELKILNDTLQKENTAKDREIRRLIKDAQQYEQTIINLRSEMAHSKQYNKSDVPKKDAEVMAGMCCTGNECGDWEPVRECSLALREETCKYQERIQKMETNLKASSDSVRALRKMNVALSEELQHTQRVFAALGEQHRAVIMRTHFKEDIIREMRRQLNQAKNKLKELSEAKSTSNQDSGNRDYPRSSVSTYDSVTIACVRTQPRRKRDAPAAQLQRSNSDDACSPRLEGSGDDAMSARMD